MPITNIATGAVNNLTNSIQAMAPTIIALVVILVIIFIIYKLITAAVKRLLNKTTVKKNEKDKIIGIWRYGYLFFAGLALIFTFSGSLAATGLSVGLMTAALGWALQKPITGIAAWLMLIVKKTFKTGDRIIVGDIKGDVEKIEMFYLSLREIGGNVQGEERSGRIIMIPTSTLFDVKITNYSFEEGYVMDEIGVEFTYQSSLAEAEKIMEKAAIEVTKEYLKDIQIKPFVRYFFNPSGIRLRVRYYVKAAEMQKVMSEITKKIYEQVMKSKKITFAYPHTQVVFESKTSKASA